jgi:hypothetical protein
MAGFGLRLKNLASTQSRVRILKAQLLAAKVSNPEFRPKRGNPPRFQRPFLNWEYAKFESSEASQPVRQPEIVLAHIGAALRSR